MKYKNPLLVSEDLEKARKFYTEVIGLHVIADFGSNITLTGGICLQTKQSYFEFIEAKPIQLGGNDVELYFEEENLEELVSKLEKRQDIQWVHPLKEHRWGQRVIRFYDPDKHIIEVAEPIQAVAQRFSIQGMNIQEIATYMDVPESFVKRWLK